MTDTTILADRAERSLTDPVSLGLHTLGWIAADSDRFGRLLALTGIDVDELRARAAEPALLAAVLAFLEAHEPDLLACAEAIGASPQALVAARRGLEA